MQNVVRPKKTLTEEELAKLKEIDWETYYRESATAEMKGLSNCPDCNAIVIMGENQSDVTCHRCGKRITS